MKKCLPINKNPLVRAYPTYSFVESVINNELTTSNWLAGITISNYQKNTWHTALGGSTVEIKGNSINVYVEPYANNSKTYFYRLCKDDDEIIVKIDRQLPVSPWENICLFISPKHDNELIEDPLYSYSMGKFYAFGFYTCQPNENKNYNSKHFSRKNPCWMKINRSNRLITFWVSFDQKTWEKLTECNMDKNKYSEYYIGLTIPYSGNHYYNWLFANFIQLCGGTSNNSALPVIYCTYPYKSHNLYGLNPFVTTLSERNTILSTYGYTLWEYIVMNINIDRYIEVNVDELYLPGTNANNNGYHHMHGNLIYGYDDITKNVNIVNYFDGKPTCMIVAYNDLKVAFESCDYEFIYIYEYYMNQVGYKMNIERICNMIQYYLSGEGFNDIGLGVMAEPLKVVYGINLYDDYVKDSKSISMLLNDNRISYIFYEHKKIMRERLEYLLVGKVVEKYEVKNIINEVDELLLISQKIMNLVLKNKVKTIPNINQRVIKYMMEMKNKEIHAYSKLYDILKSKLVLVLFNAEDDNGEILATVDDATIISNSQVLKGKNVLFTATPKENYRVKEWILNGVVVFNNRTNIYKLEDILTDVIVNVSFEFIQHPVCT